MKLNLGCGGQIVEGWRNVDRGVPEGWDLLGTDFVQLDVRDGLPCASESVDVAVAHHVLDLFTAAELAFVLADLHRVLKQGSTLRVSLADAMGAIEAAERFDDGFFAVTSGTWSTVQESLDNYLTLGGARKSFLTRTLMAEALKAAGFTPYVVAYKHTLAYDASIVDLDTRPTESIWLEGVK